MHLIAFEKIGCLTLNALVKSKNKNAIRMNKVFGSHQIGETYIKSELFIKIVFYQNNWFNGLKKNTRKLLKYVE